MAKISCLSEMKKKHNIMFDWLINKKSDVYKKNHGKDSSFMNVEKGN